MSLGRDVTNDLTQGNSPPLDSSRTLRVAWGTTEDTHCVAPVVNISHTSSYVVVFICCPLVNLVIMPAVVI